MQTWGWDCGSCLFVMLEASDVQKGPHALTSYVMVIPRGPSPLFRLCSCIVLEEMSDYPPLDC